MLSFRNIFIATVLLSFGTLSAASFSDRNLNQDYMITTPYSIMILSPFEYNDIITCYSSYGTKLWEVTFPTKVLSWKIQDGYIYALTKDRIADITYLHCINSSTGYIVWERP